MGMNIYAPSTSDRGQRSVSLARSPSSFLALRYQLPFPAFSPDVIATRWDKGGDDGIQRQPNDMLCFLKWVEPQQNMGEELVVLRVSISVKNHVLSC